MKHIPKTIPQPPVRGICMLIPEWEPSIPSQGRMLVRRAIGTVSQVCPRRSSFVFAFDRYGAMANSKYAAAHENVAGPGDARPFALQIIKDQEMLGKLKSKVMLITGCSSGTGVVSAFHLFSHLIVCSHTSRIGGAVPLGLRRKPKCRRDAGHESLQRNCPKPSGRPLWTWQGSPCWLLLHGPAHQLFQLQQTCNSNKSPTISTIPKYRTQCYSWWNLTNCNIHFCKAFITRSITTNQTISRCRIQYFCW